MDDPHVIDIAVVHRNESFANLLTYDRTQGEFGLKSADVSRSINGSFVRIV